MWLLSYASVDSGYGLVAGVLALLGVGMAIAMAPATDSIMGSLPPKKAGVGALAVNDTTREIGGAVGVAILGSITASPYRSQITNSPVYAVAAKQVRRPRRPRWTHRWATRPRSPRIFPASSAKYVITAANAAFVHALDHTVAVGAFACTARRGGGRVSSCRHGPAG